MKKAGTCSNCDYTFRWKELFFFGMSTSKPCPQCKEQQFLTLSSRRRAGMAVLVIPFSLLLNLFFDLSMWQYGLLLLIIAAAIFVWMPRQFRFTDKEEFLF